VPVVVSTVTPPTVVAKFEVLLACFQYSNPSLGKFRGVEVFVAENITEEVDVPVEAVVVEVFFEGEVFVDAEVILVEVDEDVAVVLAEVDEDVAVVLVEVDEDVAVGVSKSTLW
jgi:hypothetical protein